jgi:iron complex transport system ATP-binding protein
MTANLSSRQRPTLTGVRELSSAGRLAAWGSAALAGTVSPDEAADEVCGPRDAAHRVLGLPGESGTVNLPYALARLRSLGVAHLAERRFGTLSEGERKRVQIARALMTDPELMLLDEPAAGLDLGGREDLVRRLGLIAADEDAPALVLVTHHVEEIPPGFTHVLLLRAGRVVAAGPLATTLTAGTLADTFGIALELARTGPRWTARAT